LDTLVLQVYTLKNLERPEFIERPQNEDRLKFSDLFTEKPFLEPADTLNSHASPLKNLHKHPEESYLLSVSFSYFLNKIF